MSKWRELDMGDLEEKQHEFEFKTSELEFKMTKLRIERDSAVLELDRIREKLHDVTIKYLDADRDRVRQREVIRKSLQDMREVKNQLEELARLNMMERVPR